MNNNFFPPIVFTIPLPPLPPMGPKEAAISLVVALTLIAGALAYDGYTRPTERPRSPATPGEVQRFSESLVAGPDPAVLRDALGLGHP